MHVNINKQAFKITMYLQLKPGHWDTSSSATVVFTFQGTVPLWLDKRTQLVKLRTNSRLASTKLYKWQCQNILQNDFPNLTKHLGHTMKIVNELILPPTRWQLLLYQPPGCCFPRNSLTFWEMIYRCLTKLFTSYQKVLVLQFFENGLNDSNLDES